MSTNQIKAKRRRYPSDISQNGWKKLKPYLPASDSGKRTGRQRTDLKAVINGILYVAKTGCIWRSMPDGLPHWATVYGYFNRWSKSGLWQQIHTFLVKKVRPGEEPQQVGRNPTPSAAEPKSATDEWVLDEATRKMLDERIAHHKAHPEEGDSWPNVKARIQNKLEASRLASNRKTA